MRCACQGGHDGPEKRYETPKKNGGSAFTAEKILCRFEFLAFLPEDPQIKEPGPRRLPTSYPIESPTTAATTTTAIIRGNCTLQRVLGKDQACHYHVRHERRDVEHILYKRRHWGLLPVRLERTSTTSIRHCRSGRNSWHPFGTRLRMGFGTAARRRTQR